MRPTSAIEAGATTMVVERWESGSDFELTQATGPASFPWTGRPHSLWGSGRDAIRGLLEWGRDEFGWQRMLMPSYFCQDVVGSTTRSAHVELYHWAPTESRRDPVEPDRSDVVFVPAMFGVPPAVAVSGDGVLVEDHSHDLLASHAFASRADYAIASLRKTLPLPDGGVLWSPAGREIPASPMMTPAHGEAVLQRLSAMTLKQLYLAGADVNKDGYRAVGIEGERRLAAGPISGISSFSEARLDSLPVDSWREIRAANLGTLRAALAADDRLEWLDVPFSAIALFEDHATRESVRQALIASRIYPSVLWPLDQPAVSWIPAEHVELSRRMLSIHVDHRYSAEDMLHVSGALREGLDRACAAA